MFTRKLGRNGPTVGALGPLSDPRLRALAVTSPRRSRRLPEVPTAAESVPGFASTTWAGLAAPRGTPPAVIARLAAATANQTPPP